MGQEEHAGSPRVDDLAGILVESEDGVLASRILNSFSKSLTPRQNKLECLSLARL